MTRPEPAARAGSTLEVNGHRLYVECSGRGAPTVVLESALGCDHHAWDLVQPELATRTRVLRYDRARLGLSEPVGTPRPVRDLVEDLDALLHAADGDRPYVLVGHSFGGILVRLYADLHPREVAGVVLVDSSHPDQLARAVAALPKLLPVRRRIAAHLRSRVGPDSNEEGVDVAAAFAAARATGPLDGTPLVVITAARRTAAPAGRVLGRRLDGVWRSLQRELARLSPESIHVIARTSGHDVLSSQPALVVAAVEEVVRSVQTGAPLRPCADVFPALEGECL